MKDIDLKSLIIGFLLVATLMLSIGAKSGTQDIRIVGIDKHFADWDAIKAEIDK